MMSCKRLKTLYLHKITKRLIMNFGLPENLPDLPKYRFIPNIIKLNQFN